MIAAIVLSTPAPALTRRSLIEARCDAQRPVNFSFAGAVLQEALYADAAVLGVEGVGEQFRLDLDGLVEGQVVAA